MMLPSTSLQRFFSYHHLPVTSPKRVREGLREGGSQDAQRAENIKQHIKLLCLLANFLHINPVLNLFIKIFWSQRLMPAKFTPGQGLKDTTFLRMLWKQESHNSHLPKAALMWGVHREKCCSHPNSASSFRHSLCLIEHICMALVFISNGHLPIWTSLLTVFLLSRLHVVQKGWPCTAALG